MTVFCFHVVPTCQVTGLPELYYPSWKRKVKYVVSALVTLFMLGVAFVVRGLPLLARLDHVEARDLSCIIKATSPVLGWLRTPSPLRHVLECARCLVFGAWCLVCACSGHGVQPQPAGLRAPDAEHLLHSGVVTLCCHHFLFARDALLIVPSVLVFARGGQRFERFSEPGNIFDPDGPVYLANLPVRGAMSPVGAPRLGVAAASH